jgi:hypothetical protein
MSGLNRTDGPGAHAAYTQHCPRLLFETPRHGEEHVSRRKITCVREDDDAREGKLGIDVAGQAENRNQARNHQQARQQVNGATVLATEADDVHDLTLILACAGRP